MKLELERKLIENFPKLYGDYNKSPTITNMCFGFQHDSGWNDLIWELSTKIQKLADKEGNFQPRATTVKEKYGELSYNISSGTDKLFDLIELYERKSAYVCESCGKYGELRNTFNWYVTHCDDCHKKYIIKKCSYADLDPKALLLSVFKSKSLKERIKSCQRKLSAFLIHIRCMIA